MPFWKKYMVDTEKGGFYGAVDKNLKPIKNAPKSAVLMTRMLWAYSNAYDVTKDEDYARLAEREFVYIRDHFWDPVYGGVYWMVGPDGDPFDTIKRTYAQACFLYAVSEYYYIFRNEEVFEKVKNYSIDNALEISRQLLLKKATSKRKSFFG